MGKRLRIAILHDYLNQYGGAERCLEAFHDIFPEAPVYTLVYDSSVLPQYSGWDIRTSFVDKIPFARYGYRYFIPLFPMAVKSFNLYEYDLVISMSHAWVKGAFVPNGVHINYCLTPTRYIWDLYDEYKRDKYIPLLGRLSLPAVAFLLRKWDLAANKGIDRFVAISETVKERIAKYYNSDSEIIYPPVKTDFFVWKKYEREDFFITVSRLKAYKRIDLIVKAFAENKLPLKVVGKGPELPRLKKLASENIEFLTNVDDGGLVELYNRAKGFVFAGFEDFGIVNAEALSCGLPVIAYNRGGAAEIVDDGVSGILYDEQSPEGINRAIERFFPMKFDSAEIRNAGLKFSEGSFKEKWIELVRNYGCI